MTTDATGTQPEATISPTHAAKYRRMNAAQRREWLIDYVRKNSLVALKTGGGTQRLAKLFGVDRTMIWRDFEVIGPKLKVVDLEEIEVDLRHQLQDIVVVSKERFYDKTMTPSQRAEFGRLAVQGAREFTKMLESFGRKDRDMAPPPKPENVVVTDERLAVMAQEFAKKWEAENVKKPEKKPDCVPQGEDTKCRVSAEIVAQ